MLKKISILIPLLIALLTLTSIASAVPDKYLYITLPRDGFQDNTTNMVVRGVYDIGSIVGPYNEANVSFSVLCPQLSPSFMNANVDTLANSFNVTNGQGDFGFNFNNLSVGKYQVTVKVYYKDILQVSDTVNFEILPKDQIPDWQNNSNTNYDTTTPTTNIVTPPPMPPTPSGFTKFIYFQHVGGTYCVEFTKEDFVVDTVNAVFISKDGSWAYRAHYNYNNSTKAWELSGSSTSLNAPISFPLGNKILKSNYDVYNANGTLRFKANVSTSSTSTGSTSSSDTKMYIVLPRDGFKDVGNLMKLGMYFETTKADAIGSDWSWNFTCTQIDLNTVSTLENNKYYTSQKYGGIDLILNPLPFGKYTVTAELSYKGQKVATDTVNFELLAQQTDTNNDGVDDNTNLPIDWGTTIYTPPTAQTDSLPDKSKYSNDILGNVAWGFDTLVAIISYPFKLLATFISMLVENAKMLTSAFGGATKFFGDLLKWMPTELKTLVLTVCGILSAITVWKVARN